MDTKELTLNKTEAEDSNRENIGIDSDGQIHIEKLRNDLALQGFELISDRKRVSGGIFGPINILEVKDVNTGENFKILEKTFVYGGKEGEPTKGKGYLQTKDNKYGDNSFLKVISGSSGKVEYVINWAMNEERAMRDLEGISGIPKVFCRSTDGLKSSILMEYIDGQDLDLMSMDESVDNLDKIKDIFTKLKDTF